MSVRDFDPRDPATWGMVLNLREVAAIYGCTADALRARLKPSCRHTFIPAPYRRGPYLWRRADVLRDVEGARAIARTA